MVPGAIHGQQLWHLGCLWHPKKAPPGCPWPGNDVHFLYRDGVILVRWLAEWLVAYSNSPQWAELTTWLTVLADSTVHHPAGPFEAVNVKVPRFPAGVGPCGHMHLLHVYYIEGHNQPLQKWSY